MILTILLDDLDVIKIFALVFECILLLQIDAQPVSVKKMPHPSFSYISLLKIEEDPVEEKVELEPPEQKREVEDVVETAEEMGVRKAAEYMDRDRVTFEEWEEMGPNARKLLGLPTSKVGAQNATENGFIELPKGKVKRETIAARMAELEPGSKKIKSVRDKIKEIFPNTTDEEIETGMDTGTITELDLSVMAEFGEDIFKYMQEQGLDENAEAFDIMRALSEWADANNKRLPYNTGFLTLQFQKAFRR